MELVAINLAPRASTPGRPCAPRLGVVTGGKPAFPVPRAREPGLSDSLGLLFAMFDGHGGAPIGQGSAGRDR